MTSDHHPVVLFVATSLDGFVADADGGVGWLFTDGDYGYADFFAGVGALLMGRTTYDQVLGFGAWPYGDTPAVVFTHRPLGRVPDGARVEAASGDPAPVVGGLRARGGGDLWLVGGGALVRSFRERALIDRYVLAVHPVLLGAGVPLFGGALPRESLRLADATPYPSGLVQLTYDRLADA